MRPQMVMSLDDADQAAPVTATLVQALGDSDRGVREQAAMGLAITPGADVIEPLLGALKDPDAQVREKAAIGLAFRRDPRIIDPLLTRWTTAIRRSVKRPRLRSARAATRARSRR